jgi:hypothetical protein
MLAFVDKANKKEIRNVYQLKKMCTQRTSDSIFVHLQSSCDMRDGGAIREKKAI